MTKVLLVEDSPTQAVRTQIALKSQSFEVLVENESRSAIDTAKAERPDGDDRFKDLPFILVTSLDSKDSRKKGIAAGADAYIVKGGVSTRTSCSRRSAG
jgi:DNA-binding response OmpR family regulator